MEVAHGKWGVTSTQAVACCLLIALGGCKPEAPVPTAASSSPTLALAEQLTAGAEVYAQNCAQCHFAGEGGATAPPLVGSQALQSESTALIKIILQGQRNQSMVKGQKFNGIMPAMPYLSDDEVAVVAAYLRQRFGRNAEPVEPSQVARERKSLGVD